MSEESKPGDKLSGVRVSAAKCVRCAQPVQPRYRPFCSQRCADIDLGAWFRGTYRVASDEGPDPGGGGEDEKG
ncbi:MAG: DNA gyrase inhibitor YacG [Rhodospirillaceae bacterium]|nr:DNA gyrase inhibitor YacG [Rhodospirillaceae bacterium]